MCDILPFWLDYTIGTENVSMELYMDTIIQITLGLTAILLIVAIVVQSPANSIGQTPKVLQKVYAHKSTSVLQKGTWFLGFALVSLVVLQMFV